MQLVTDGKRQGMVTLDLSQLSRNGQPEVGLLDIQGVILSVIVGSPFEFFFVSDSPSRQLIKKPEGSLPLNHYQYCALPRSLWYVLP